MRKGFICKPEQNLRRVNVQEATPTTVYHLRRACSHLENFRGLKIELHRCTIGRQQTADGLFDEIAAQTWPELCGSNTVRNALYIDRAVKDLAFQKPVI